MPEEQIFQARGVSKTYGSGAAAAHALREVDLDLYPHELVVLLGPSGSGKSTLLNILGGLDTPASGDVRFRDHLLTAADQRELTRYRREHVGFVFQFSTSFRASPRSRTWSWSRRSRRNRSIPRRRCAL